MIINRAILKFKTEPPLLDHVNYLRGYIANRFSQYSTLHNHKKDGSFLYLYPRIQYRIINGEGLIVGIEDGAAIVRLIESQVEAPNLKGVIYRITQKQLLSEDVLFGVTDAKIKYHFIKPWLALNEDNYIEYKELAIQEEKEIFLMKILRGNLLSMAKSLGCIVDQQIKVTSLIFKEKESSLKGIPMIGFLGTFSVNFNIPDYLGIGKSVSRGFGTVKRIDPDLTGE